MLGREKYNQSIWNIPWEIQWINLPITSLTSLLHKTSTTLPFRSPELCLADTSSKSVILSLPAVTWMHPTITSDSQDDNSSVPLEIPSHKLEWQLHSHNSALYKCCNVLPVLEISTANLQLSVYMINNRGDYTQPWSEPVFSILVLDICP